MLAGPAVRVWVGADYAAAGGLTAVAVASIALAAPLQVGSNLLLGVGRARDILRAAAVAIAVNVAGTIVLVNTVGIVGAFQATLLAAAVLYPLLGRPMLRHVGVAAGDFVRRAILPLAVPLGALAAVLGVVVGLPFGDEVTLAVGAAAGAAVYVATIVRWGFEPGEPARIRSYLSHGSPSPLES
jgi:O-antigen/teichoic acid export membrane protein